MKSGKRRLHSFGDPNDKCNSLLRSRNKLTSNEYRWYDMVLTIDHGSIMSSMF